MSNETQVKQEDRELIKAIAEPWICVESPPCENTESVHWEELLTSLTAALATIRKEARRELWDEVLQIADWHLSEPSCFGYSLRNKLAEVATKEERNDGSDETAKGT